MTLNSPSETQPVQHAFEPASMFRRLTNFFIDFFLAICAPPLTALTISATTGNTAMEDFLEANANILAYVILFSYYFFFELVFQRTPGKWITRTLVVDSQGARPTIAAVFIRTIVRFVPFEPFSFLAKTPIGWHDRGSKTRVIRLRKAGHGA